MTDEMLEQVKKQGAKLNKEFNKYWEENGKPHPSSNAYIAMNRAFYYMKGFESAMALDDDDEA